MLCKRVVVLLSGLPMLIWCQKPVISPNGVVNAASYSTTPDVSGPVRYGLSGGSIASIFGTDLASTAERASTIPLPMQLGSTTVTVSGLTVPLFYVSPGQINFQMPSPWLYSSGLGTATIVVSTASGTSDPYRLDWAGAPGIFTRDASGCGQGSALNIHSDGTVTINSPEDSVSPGEYIAVFGTGLGLVYNSPPDGVPAQSTPPLATASSGGGLDFDFVSYGNAGTYFWAGRAPGLVGVDQFNFRIPDNVREGCAVPVRAVTAYGVSQPVTISIRKGGGPCVDPTSAGYGQITWEKAFIIEPLSSPRETDTFTAFLQASPGKRLPPSSTGSRRWDYFGPSCPLPGYRSLDAGDVAIRGPGFGSLQAPMVPLQTGQVRGLDIYQAVLPTGAIQGGSFSATAGGGADVGSFQSTLRIGQEIHITTALAGRVISNRGPDVIITWDGGDADASVTAVLVSHQGSFDWSVIVASVRASEHTLTMSPNAVVGYGIGNGPVELLIEVTPTEPQAFSAPGLSLGGQHLWKYTYRFQALLLQ